jgi:hypothetical protein
MKEGEFVVCVDPHAPNPRVIMPALNEIVTISTFYSASFVYLKEYPLARNGKKQAIHIRHFRPIDYSFGESVIEKLEKESIQITVEV